MVGAGDSYMILGKLKQQFGDRLKENEPMARYTTLKIGGPADYFLEVRTRQELIDVVSSCRQHNIPLFILGGGSNILIGDRGIRGLVVKNAAGSITLRGMKGSTKGDNIVFVEADAGVIFNQLVRFTLEEGLSGLEMHLGLPGTVGGAMYMNSKWTKPVGYVGDVVYQATIITSDGQQKTVPHSYFQFAYDYSSLQKTHEVVVSIVFALKRQPKEVLWEIANKSIMYRRDTQPQGVFSPGCTFRNISNAQALSIPTPNGTTSAGFLVDHAGLKGKQVGRAQISPVHANFIVNLGGATARDVVQLIDLAKTEAKRQFGVFLEEEIVRVGQF